MKDDLPLLICLMGPTASGKTDLAIALAGEFDCELVSVDSALVYRGMDIGSAKPTYPHHLVDIRDPADPYSAAEFAADARELVLAIRDRGRTPLLVGGSMLYFRAFLQGLAEMPTADPELRAQIEAEAGSRGWPALHAELAEVDPEAAARIHPNHSQRIGRALEVYRASGLPMSDWHRAEGNSPFDPAEHFRVRQLAIRPRERAVLHNRIEQRFTQMLAAGLLDEVRALVARGDLDESLPSVRAVGYRQLWAHLKGTRSLDEATQDALAATRQLAKRQLTWLRKWHDLASILIDHEGNGCELVLPGEKYGRPFATPLAAALAALA